MRSPSVTPWRNHDGAALRDELGKLGLGEPLLLNRETVELGPVVFDRRRGARLGLGRFGLADHAIRGRVDWITGPDLREGIGWDQIPERGSGRLEGDGRRVIPPIREARYKRPRTAGLQTLPRGRRAQLGPAGGAKTPDRPRRPSSGARREARPLPRLPSALGGEDESLRDLPDATRLPPPLCEERTRRHRPARLPLRRGLERAASRLQELLEARAPALAKRGRARPAADDARP
jgi:hypothetical protein